MHVCICICIILYCTEIGKVRPCASSCQAGPREFMKLRAGIHRDCYLYVQELCFQQVVLNQLIINVKVP